MGPQVREPVVYVVVPAILPACSQQVDCLQYVLTAPVTIPQSLPPLAVSTQVCDGQSAAVTDLLEFRNGGIHSTRLPPVDVLVPPPPPGEEDIAQKVAQRLQSIFRPFESYLSKRTVINSLDLATADLNSRGEHQNDLTSARGQTPEIRPLVIKPRKCAGSQLGTDQNARKQCVDRMEDSVENLVSYVRTLPPVEQGLVGVMSSKSRHSIDSPQSTEGETLADSSQSISRSLSTAMATESMHLSGGMQPPRVMDSSVLPNQQLQWSVTLNHMNDQSVCAHAETNSHPSAQGDENVSVTCQDGSDYIAEPIPSPSVMGQNTASDVADEGCEEVYDLTRVKMEPQPLPGPDYQIPFITAGGFKDENDTFGTMNLSVQPDICQTDTRLVESTRRTKTRQRWACDMCTYTCASEKTLHRHKRTHKTTVQRKSTRQKRPKEKEIKTISKWACHLCKFMCGSDRVLQEHMGKSHRPTVMPERKPCRGALHKYRCAYCPRHYKIRICLVTHHRRCHPGLKPSIRSSSDDWDYGEDDKVSQQAQTAVLQEDVPSVPKEDTKRKKREKRPKKPIYDIFASEESQVSGMVKCSFCELLFADVKGLFVHQVQKHREKINSVRAKDRKTYLCHLCGNSFYSSLSLRSHLWRIHQEKPTTVSVISPDALTCARKDCNFVTHDIMKMRKHRQRHAYKDLKLTMCTKCGKMVKCLHNHMKSHIDLFQYVCDQPGCTAKFRKEANLKVHKMRHSGEKPMKCDLCPYACRQRPCMDFHMKSKHGMIKKLDTKNRSYYVLPEMEVLQNVT